MAEKLLKSYEVGSFKISKYEELGSTMNLTRLGQINEVTFTELQTSGRGKTGRKWEGMQGNLFFSIKLQPQKTLKETSQLSFVSAMALRRAIKSLDKEDKLEVLCKWPNDVLVNGCKVAGILLESDVMSYSKNNNEFGEIILGIGVNIKHSPELNTMYKATNLRKEGIETTAEELLNIFLKELQKSYDDWHKFGFPFIRNEWIKFSHNLGKEVKFKINDSSDMIYGIFKDFTEDGEMVAELPDGSIQIVSSADIFN